MGCSSRNCSRCFPPHSEAISVLRDVVNRVDYCIKDEDSVLGWNTDEYWEFHDKPWFQAILMAYNTGVRAARAEVQFELDLLTYEAKK